MPFAELYSALEKGEVDEQENTAAHILAQKLYQVQKNVSRTGHMHMGTPIIINKSLFDGMQKKYQDALLQAGREMGPIHTGMVDELEATQWKDIESRGMKITDVDKAPFREAVKPVIEQFKNRFDLPLIEEITPKRTT